MAGVWEPPDLNHCVERYLAGASLKQMASGYGVARRTLTLALQRHGIPIRGWTEANKLVAANKTPEQHLACSMAGRAGVAGKPRPEHLLEQRAQTNEARARLTGPYERNLAGWLADLQPVLQKAQGRYNLDFAIGPVAVEIFGGKRHSYGRHAQRHAQRTKYLLDRGWLLIFVWASNTRWSPQVADYVRTWHDLACRDPALRGQYRVVWGDGQDITALCPDFHQFPRVPPAVPDLGRRP